MDFNHFIITRFNLKLYSTDKHNLPTRTESWLRDRFEIFERYCLPSVAAQHNKQFTWLCLFDAQTPDAYRQRIASYRCVCPQFHPVYLDDNQTHNLSESLYAVIAEELAAQANNVDAIVTTNLDNDDSLSIYAIDELQKSIRKEQRIGQVYSLLYGYQYFENTGFITKMRYPNNHFLTLVEPNQAENFKTIAVYTHATVTKRLPTSYIHPQGGGCGLR